MEKIGVIAGNGKFPYYFIKGAKESNFKVYSVLLEDEAERELESIVDEFIWLSPGKLGGIIKYFKKNNIKEIVLVGQVKHTKLYKVIPDTKAVKLLLSVKDKKADSLLKAVVDEFEKEGMKVLPSILFLEKMLVKEKIYTPKKPNKKEIEDIKFGFKMAKGIGELDIGQTVVVKDKAVIAVEAMEGTDNCIKRAGNIVKDFVFCKVSKPRQDLRFDVPVVGKKTVEVLIEAGAKIMAVEADKTLFFEEEEAVKIAEENGIIIVGTKYEEG